MPRDNILYLTVLPLIPTSSVWVSNEQTREYLTLFPDANFATEFFPDEVDAYIAAFHARSRGLVGGHVTGYTYEKETAVSGRVRVKVIQHVQ
jgi:hypothetical protein